MISKWCKSQGIKLSDLVHHINEEGIEEANHDHFLSLLEKMSLTLSFSNCSEALGIGDHALYRVSVVEYRY
jgi:hypothetical protein